MVSSVDGLAGAAAVGSSGAAAASRSWDALGNPVRFILTAGQVADICQAEGLMEGFSPPYSHTVRRTQVPLKGPRAETHSHWKYLKKFQRSLKRRTRLVVDYFEWLTQ
jgi:hypothetical protein